MEENSIFDKISYILDDIIVLDVVICVLSLSICRSPNALNILNGLFVWDGYKTLFEITGYIAIGFAGFDILGNIICLISDFVTHEAEAKSVVLSIFNILAGVAFFVVPIFILVNTGHITIIESIIFSGLVYIGFTLVVGPIENLSFRVLLDNIIDVLKIGSVVLALFINEAWYVPMAIFGIELIAIIIETIVSIKNDDFEGSDKVALVLNILIYAAFVAGIVTCVTKQLPFVETTIIALLCFTLVDYALGAVMGTIANTMDVVNGDDDD